MAERIIKNDFKKKRVLVVCQHFWPESFRINDICDYLVEKNCEVDVLCGIPNYPKGKFFEGYGYFGKRKEIHRGVNINRVLEIPRGSNSNIRIFVNYISFPFFSLFHVPRFLTKDYDKVFIYQLSPVLMAISGILVGKIKKTETIMYVLDLWPENLYSVLKIKNRYLRLVAESISHWHYRQANKLVVLSEKMKKKIKEITKIDDNKILVLPQVCEKIYEKQMSDDNLRKRFENKFNILYTGNISPAQSFETIVDAAKTIKNGGIDDINWIIVGDGMSKKWLIEKVEQAGLSGDFYFEGQKPIEDIPKYFDIADLLVGCLVKSELLEATIPAKAMSYFASGRPMVLAMDGEVQELVNNIIRCGFASKTGDHLLLSQNILKIYRLSAKERVMMGEKGRGYHMKNFERDRSMLKLERFIFENK
jgi:colanic acid biosynthesis glycosyl transferase WcaI